MTTVSRRTALSGIACVAGLSLIVACNRFDDGLYVYPPDRTPDVLLRLACGEEGGRYIQFGRLLRDVLLARGGPVLDLVVTNGSAENLDLLGAREVDLAMSLADALSTDTQLSNEEPRQERAFRPARLTNDSLRFVGVGKVYQNYLQCVTLASGSVTSLEDLAGSAVSIGAPGSGSSITARRVLKVSGILGSTHPPFVREEPLESALHSLISGAIEALFWSSGVPAPMINDLTASTRFRLIDLSDIVPALQFAYPGLYLDSSIPAGVYDSVHPIRTVGIPNYLVARPDLPEYAARAIVDALIADAHALVPDGSVGVQYFTPATLIDTGALELHSAARQRYRELYG